MGVDASINRDSTALVGVLAEPSTQRVRLVNCRVFKPTVAEPLDFEATIQATLREWNERFYVLAGILYDPYQLVAVAQRLTSEGLSMIGFPQTIPRLVELATSLHEVLTSHVLRMYPDDDLRSAAMAASSKETGRGTRIVKSGSGRKIDALIALAMAVYACLKYGVGWIGQNEPGASNFDLESLYGR